jgi:hypothetical protein
MTSSSTLSPVPVHCRLRCALLAGSVVLAPLALATWFATCPTFDAGCLDQAHTDAVLADFRTCGRP